MNIADQINHETKIVGVIGHPIKHSFSPRMHNLTFCHQDLNYVYLPFDVPPSNLKEALKSFNTLGVKGLNVTLPHKEKIIQYLDHVSEAAAAVGAVNTVVSESGLLHGYNTDIRGIVETLNPYKDEIAKSTVTVIGAGGAARSVIFSLIRHFKVDKINIVNRTQERSDSIKDYFKDKMHFDNIETHELMPLQNVKVFQSSKLIVNSTTVGLFPNVNETPTDIADSFNSNQIVFDLIYNPIKTKFLELAESKGAKTLSGLKMFVVQGAKSFEYWTGKTMDTEKIIKDLTKALTAK
ncbi:MAG: shikimate dehydrogenase [Melioribacteraceae bacterium]